MGCEKNKCLDFFSEELNCDFVFKVLKPLERVNAFAKNVYVHIIVSRLDFLYF